MKKKVLLPLLVLFFTAAAYFVITTELVGGDGALSYAKHAEITSILGFYLALAAATATVLNYFFSNGKALFKKEREGPPENKSYAMK